MSFGLSEDLGCPLCNATPCVCDEESEQSKVDRLVRDADRKIVEAALVWHGMRSWNCRAREWADQNLAQACIAAAPLGRYALIAVPRSTFPEDHDVATPSPNVPPVPFTPFHKSFDPSAISRPLLRLRDWFRWWCD